MNLSEIHLEIAKERFLEMVAKNEEGDIAEIALTAIEQANKFVDHYEYYGRKESDSILAPAKQKGCRACYGSGGKKNAPCKVCHGTGKVDKE